MKVLLIDDDDLFAEIAAGMLVAIRPDIEVEYLNPLIKGRPGADFPLSQFAFILLDYQLGVGNGLDWLREFKVRAGCPPVIMLTGQGDENLAVAAIKAGADDYQPKMSISPAVLERVVSEALVSRALSRDQTVRLDKAEIERGDPLAGVRIEGYRVTRELARGTTGRVFLVAPEAGGPSIVAKVLFAELMHEQDFLARFLREYRIVGSIRSPYVGRIFDYGSSNSTAYILMEYLAGGDLRSYFSERQVNQGRILTIFRQVMVALRDIHAAGVVHRDLKPQNIMFRHDRSVAVVDFGIAKKMGAPDSTGEGEILGTPNFLSPEAIRGGPVDGRTDLYSAGAMLYQLVAKSPPFRGDTAAQVLQAHLDAPVPRLPRSMEEFQPLIDLLLQKDPADRAASAGDVVEFIDRHYYG
jgi:serine/threonine protein kinase/CheY-like chemotaxis protein